MRDVTDVVEFGALLSAESWHTMLVVMQSHATPEQVEAVVETDPGAWASSRTRCRGPHARRSASPATRASSIRARWKSCPGVLELLRVTKPYKLASREMHIDDTVVRCRKPTIGPGRLHDHRRAVLGRERSDDLPDGRVPGKPGRQADAGRGLQAADQPLQLSGHGARGARTAAARRDRSWAWASSPR